jgi:NDP-sugar pyrophosphorylase family protein
MKALILAGGYATRLRPLSCTRPKLLFPVAGRPMLEWTVENLAKGGVDEIILAVNYLADMLRRHFKARFKGVRIRYSVDPTPLGTGGPIKQAQRLLENEEAFLAMNGDILSETPIRSMLQAHRETGAVATIALYKVENPSRFGVAKIADQTRIEAFIEKPKKSSAPSSWINAGIYIMGPKVFDYIDAGRKVSTEREVFPLLAKKEKLYGFKYYGPWFDIGKFEDYVRANNKFLERVSMRTPIVGDGTRVSSTTRLVPPVVINRKVRIGDDCVIGPYAVIDDYAEIGRGAKITQSIIFREARIGESSSINGSIVGENAVIGKDAKLRGGTIVSDYVLVRDNVRLGPDIVVCPHKEIDRSILKPMHVK